MLKAYCMIALLSVIFTVMVAGCATEDPLFFHKDLHQYYQTKDGRLLLVVYEGDVFDISCLGIEWVKENFRRGLEQHPTCDPTIGSVRKVGKVLWDHRKGNWDVTGYDIPPVCRPRWMAGWISELEVHLFGPPDTIGIKYPNEDGTMYSCWNRAWEWPIKTLLTPLELVQRIVFLPVLLGHGH